MRDRILDTLRALRAYALGKGHQVAILYNEEDSYLTRFANSAISLNTNEHLVRLEVTAYAGRKKASYSLITDLSKIDDMRAAIDTAAAMADHSQPLTYTPTIPAFTGTFIDESGYDEALTRLPGADKLHFVSQAVRGLESEEIKLSGIFSCGSNTVALVNTQADECLYFCTSDSQISLVLAHQHLKWEIQAEQSAQSRTDLDPDSLHRELAFLADHYQHDRGWQLPLGSYDIVFGAAATAQLAELVEYLGFQGGLMKRGYSFLTEDNVGKRVFSEKLTVTDDPTRLETFPFRRDWTGLPREPFPLVERGVFRGFVWDQDDADEFGAQPTGHTVPHASLVVLGGDRHVASLEDLVALPRDRDLLYIPFLHYMNIVNPSRGIVTGSSRFGALYLGRDGTALVPYNVRLTHSLLDVFGERLDWLSESLVAYNTSHSYGARNPTALIVPRYVRVNDLAISHSNATY